MNLSHLFEESQSLDYSHSNGMVKVTEMKGPGFFPGCTGTIDSKEEIAGLRVMVLGQDFDTEANHKNIEKNNGEIETNNTWKNLRKLLKELKLNEKECFFTNAYMGLRPDNNQIEKIKNTGKSPAAKKGAEKFSNECYHFFKKQLAIVKPKIVLVLGLETARFLSRAFPNEFKKWSAIKTMRGIYEVENNVCNVIEFEERKIKFLFVIHPSLNNINRSKFWGKEEGKTKEQEILKRHIWN